MPSRSNTERVFGASGVTRTDTVTLKGTVSARCRQAFKRAAKA